MENANDTGVLTVKFNKKELHLSRERMKALAQMGLMYEKLLPLIDGLRMLAARSNMPLGRYLSELIEDKNKAFFDEIMGKVGNDEQLAGSLIEAIDQKSGYGLPAARDEQSLRAEFEEIAEEFPAIGSFDQLESEIIAEALSAGIPLIDAVLRYEHRERRRAEKEAARRQEAAAAALTLDNDSESGSENEILAMLKGIQMK